MHRHCCGPTIGMFKENVAAPSRFDREAGPLKGTHNFLARCPGKASHSEICCIPTNSRYPESPFRSSRPKLDDLAHALYTVVNVLRVRVAAVECGHGRYQVTCFVLLDQDGELSLGFQSGLTCCKSIMRTPARRRIGVQGHSAALR